MKSWGKENYNKISEEFSTRGVSVQNGPSKIATEMTQNIRCVCDWRRIHHVWDAETPPPRQAQRDAVPNRKYPEASFHLFIPRLDSLSAGFFWGYQKSSLKLFFYYRVGVLLSNERVVGREGVGEVAWTNYNLIFDCWWQESFVECEYLFLLRSRSVLIIHNSLFVLIGVFFFWKEVISNLWRQLICGWKWMHQKSRTEWVINGVVRMRGCTWVLAIIWKQIFPVFLFSGKVLSW